MPPDTPPAFHLLVAAGLCFGLQYKVPWLHGKTTKLDRLLACPYCTGFHCGWLTWLLYFLTTEAQVPIGLREIASIVAWCFACAWVCYAMDTVVKRLETTDE